jgi:hypothetical protein
MFYQAIQFDFLIHIIGLGVFQISTKTGGSFSVALNDRHFRECVMDQIVPPPRKSNSKAGIFANMVQVSVCDHKYKACANEIVLRQYGFPSSFSLQYADGFSKEAGKKSVARLQRKSANANENGISGDKRFGFF